MSVILSMVGKGVGYPWGEGLNVQGRWVYPQGEVSIPVGKVSIPVGVGIAGGWVCLGVGIPEGEGMSCGAWVCPKRWVDIHPLDAGPRIPITH